MNPRFDWKTFLASTIAAAVISSPSWVPVFGASYEDFGSGLLAVFKGFLPVIAMVAGFIIGWNVRNNKALKDAKAVEDKLGMTIEEAAGKLKQRDEELEKDEDTLLRMRASAQLLCVTALNGHKNGKAQMRSLDEIHAFYGQGFEEATKSGFVRLEPCGIDTVRIEPTDKLKRLIDEREDVNKKLLDLAVRAGDPGWQRGDWHDITFREDGGFSLFTLEQEAEMDAAFERFKREYEKRPFWQRVLLQSLVDGDEVVMLGDQYQVFAENEFNERDALIKVRQTAGNEYSLEATDATRSIFESIPNLRDEVDLEPYFDPVPEYLSMEYSLEISISGISWYMR